MTALPSRQAIFPDAGRTGPGPALRARGRAVGGGPYPAPGFFRSVIGWTPGDRFSFMDIKGRLLPAPFKTLFNGDP